MNEVLLRTGRWLFRWRSFTPVPVALLCLWLLFESSAPLPLNAPVWWLLGVSLCFAGQVLRFVTLGQVPEGTSGQNASLQAVTLNTRGPYAHVRNPLYLGNLGLVAGVLLLTHHVYVLLIGLGFFALQYSQVVPAEEDFLRSRFGAEFDQFCSQVPRWLPRLRPAFSGPLRSGAFDWRRALKKEINPFTLWALAAVVLTWRQLGARIELTTNTGIFLGSIAAAIVLFFAFIKAWKKGWLVS